MPDTDKLDLEEKAGAEPEIGTATKASNLVWRFEDGKVVLISAPRSTDGSVRGAVAFVFRS